MKNELTEKSFNLEQQIMSCWNITSDLDTLFESVLESDLSQDQIANIVLGLKQLYDIKFDKLFRTFEQVHSGVCKLSKEDV